MLKQLGEGYTNYVYKYETPNLVFVIRIYREGTYSVVDRELELEFYTHLDLVLFKFPGGFITKFIDGNVLDPNYKHIKKIAPKLKEFHDINFIISKQKVKPDCLQIVEDYSKNNSIFLKEIKKIKRNITNTTSIYKSKSLIHGDLNYLNILFDGNIPNFIDFEYINYDYIGFDIGNHISNYDINQDNIDFIIIEFLTHYNPQLVIQNEDILIIKYFILVSDMYWIVWANNMYKETNSDLYKDYIKERTDVFLKNKHFLEDTNVGIV